MYYTRTLTEQSSYWICSAVEHTRCRGSGSGRAGGGSDGEDCIRLSKHSFVRQLALRYQIEWRVYTEAQEVNVREKIVVEI